MTDDYVDRRRRYVQEIRESFLNQEKYPKKRGEIRKTMAMSEEDQPVGAFAIWKVKVWISIFALSAFIFCDKTDTLLFSMPTQTIVEHIKEDSLMPAGKDMIDEIQTHLTNLNFLGQK